MSSNFIEISGLTPLKDFPCCSQKYLCKELCNTDTFYLANIYDINKIYVSVSISSFKTIYTPKGKKLIINGAKHIDIIYTSKKDCEDNEHAHFDVPFCTFIPLKNYCTPIYRICTAIEHIHVCQLNCKEFSVSSIIFLCPNFKKNNYIEALTNNFLSS